MSGRVVVMPAPDDGGQQEPQAQPVAVDLRTGAQMLGLGTNGLFTAIREGYGPKTFRVGRRHLVRVAELERWARELEEADHAST